MKLIDCWKCDLCGRIAFDKEEMSFHENTCDGFMYGIVTINGVRTISKYKGDTFIECWTEDSKIPSRHGVEQ